MLRQLHISNYALIDSIDIDFASGLNIITGETGAGKSIMLGALGLLLGARADTKVGKNADMKSVVEARFNVTDNESLKHFCIDSDIEWDDSECILRREILPSGRSRAFINDSPVTLAVLESVGNHLIDIHSQNHNRLLSSADFQRNIIDSLAGNQQLIIEYSEAYNAFRKAKQRLAETTKQIEQNRADEEFTRFRLGQLEDASLVEGEQEELEKERVLLANMTEIKSTLTYALNLLSEDRVNILSGLTDVIEQCENLSEVLDDASTLAERLNSAKVEIQDITETLADYDANLQADPDDLDAIEQRLDRLYSLQSRFKVDSEHKLIEVREELKRKLSMLNDSSMTLTELKAEMKTARKKAESLSAEITSRRKKAAAEFAALLTKTASPLGMANLQVVINVIPEEISATGADRIEFQFAFNKNQQPTTVDGHASGGEVSRLMLSIKSITAGKLLLPTIIFDEVDTGVSGDVANRMGEMMQKLSAEHQVITITHLPQVASKGSVHFKVFKEDDEFATHTRVKCLSACQRQAEIALMLSGSAEDSTALAAAETMLKKNNQPNSR